MYIRRIQIEKFRNLNNIELGPFTIPAQFSDLICIAGPNGAGKSSVLEILTYGITHRYSWSYYNSRDIADHAFSIQIGLTPDEIAKIVAAADKKPEIVSFLDENQGYWFFVNTKKRPNEQFSDLTNEAVHGLVSRQFSNFERKLGFFIRSDRAYTRAKYNTQNIFNSARRLTDQYLGGLSYQATSTQYTDMYEFLIEQSYDYTYSLGLYLQSQERGEPVARPTDPLARYNELLGQLFPGHSFEQVSQQDLNLKVRLPSGATINFVDMSSGEKEVFFILSFFIRHQVSNSIIIIDEPELHLHSELARKLLRLMRKIMPGNQVICATHSVDLVDEAGRENTFFLRKLEDRSIVCEPATKESAAIQALRDMFGYSGYIGVTKKLVFVEGDNNSADRRTFINLFPDLSEDIKLVPVGSWDSTYRVNRAVLSIVESNIGFLEAYCIRDRDYLSEAAILAQQSRGKNKLFILDRKEIENYLLDDAIISEIMLRIYGIQLSEQQVRDELLKIARQISAATLRDMAESRFQDLYQSEDCSIGGHSENLRIIDDQFCPDSSVIDPIEKMLINKIAQINSAIVERTTHASVQKIFDDCKTHVLNALNSEDWRKVFSGKALLKKFSATHNLGEWPALQNLIIERLATARERIPHSLTNIFRAISP